jgi:hypothetical protein
VLHFELMQKPKREIQNATRLEKKLVEVVVDDRVFVSRRDFPPGF